MYNNNLRIVHRARTNCTDNRLDCVLFVVAGMITDSFIAFLCGPCDARCRDYELARK
jgi:hypothetical protein